MKVLFFFFLIENILEKQKMHQNANTHKMVLLVIFLTFFSFEPTHVISAA